MPDNRIDQLAPPPVSPTGTPALPNSWVRYAFGLGAILLALSQFTPDHTIAHGIAERGLDLLGLVGIISQGWRKGQ